MKLSIVIPVYNEEKTLSETLAQVRALPYEMEILVVDDGSRDRTPQVIAEEAKKGDLKTFRHEKNRGKGAALRTAFEHVTGDVVIVQDADLEYDPSEYEKLLGPIKKGAADVVYGSRLSGGMPQRVYYFHHLLGNRFISLVCNTLYNSTLSDLECCYKFMRLEVLKSLKLRSNRFEIEPEITAKILKNKKWRVYEVPISYYGRTFEEGKKITWRDGFSALWTLLKYRFIN